MVVDINENTGEVMHGASGFLYGLGDDGIPTDATLFPLKPRVTAQKPNDGLQHPNGDAFDIADQFLAAGGDNIEIYMQDIYASWPYENLGIEDYLTKVEEMTNDVVAHPDRDKFVYIPFNEPDWIWYGNDIARLCQDWKMVYDLIKSIDSSARIGGINYAEFNEAHYRTFMEYAVANNCVPEVMTWHELENSFFTSYYDHYNAYRQIEEDLGLSPRPIVINEYARNSGDLGYPGNMVQWITRFENTKVDACRAYWGAAGNLDELVVENNKVNGDWWLYKWYGDMTGHTVKVTPPTQNSSLQGIASLDDSKKQLRMLFGGSLASTDVFSTDVVVKGFDGNNNFGNKVHAIVMGVDATNKDNVTGFEASDGPYKVSEADYNVVNGQITIPVNNMKALSAYQILITNDTDLSPIVSMDRYEAEYSELSGMANIVSYETNYSSTGYVQGFGYTNDAAVTYTTSVPENGYYDVTLRYSAGQFPNAPSTRYVRMALNGNYLKDVEVSETGGWSNWSDVTTTLYLQGGINQLTFSAYTNDELDCVNQDYIELSPATGTVLSIEAEASENTFGGAASVQISDAASGGQHVGWIGHGSSNTLSINNINVSEAGTYSIVVRYANAEMIGEHSYNTNVVDRTSDIVVNGVLVKDSMHFRNTYEWTNFSTTVLTVELKQGSNSIMFKNDTAYAPDIDKIEVAKLLK